MVDRDGYLDVRSRSASVLDLDAKLPGQAFKKGAGESLFCEFDAVLTREFRPALREMARWHGDDRIERLGSRAPGRAAAPAERRGRPVAAVRRAQPWPPVSVIRMAASRTTGRAMAARGPSRGPLR
ncbi:hypothetical protein ACFY4B_29990 [Kitasatospora sp. NPDC001261]|uniref:hypothetical protein n=1 Tax=Kitasatospora sp. NPDC001261 TaxID=3364012 RepID=UPI0036AB5082